MEGRQRLHLLVPQAVQGMEQLDLQYCQLLEPELERQQLLFLGMDSVRQQRHLDPPDEHQMHEHC